METEVVHLRDSITRHFLSFILYITVAPSHAHIIQGALEYKYLLQFLSNFYSAMQTAVLARGILSVHLSH